MGAGAAFVTNIAVYLIKIVASGFVVVAAAFIEMLIQMNSHIPELPAVQAGFKVTLAVANLGFVLGIIVIAIATILKRESGSL